MHDSSEAGDLDLSQWFDGGALGPFKCRGSDPEREVRKLKVDDLCLTLTEGTARAVRGFTVEQGRVRRVDSTWSLTSLDESRKVTTTR